MRGGRRSRRRGSGAGWPEIGIVVLAGLVVLTAGTPVASFSTGQTDRSPAIAVVSDTDAAHALDAQPTLNTGETCRLVTTTNNFDEALTVTVSLADDSTAYGNLTLGNGSEGDEVTFDLAAGDQQQVDLDVKNDSSIDGETVYYRVSATGSTISVVAPDRYATIDNDTSSDCTTTN